MESRGVSIASEVQEVAKGKGAVKDQELFGILERKAVDLFESVLEGLALTRIAWLDSGVASSLSSLDRDMGPWIWVGFTAFT